MSRVGKCLGYLLYMSISTPTVHHSEVTYSSNLQVNDTNWTCQCPGWVRSEVFPHFHSTHTWPAWSDLAGSNWQELVSVSLVGKGQGYMQSSGAVLFSGGICSGSEKYFPGAGSSFRSSSGSTHTNLAPTGSGFKKQILYKKFEKSKFW